MVPVVERAGPAQAVQVAEVLALERLGVLAFHRLEAVAFHRLEAVWFPAGLEEAVSSVPEVAALGFPVHQHHQYLRRHRRRHRC